MSETVKPGRRPPCQTCGQPGFYLCDYPVAPRGGGPHRSCSRVLCKQHATSVGFVAHYCPPHERASRAPVVNVGDRPRIPGFDECRCPNPPSSCSIYGVGTGRALFITINGRQALHEGPRRVGHCVYCNGPCAGATRECEPRVYAERKQQPDGRRS